MTTAQQRFAAGTAVVTGGGSGIGEGLVRHLADLGMTVVVADVDLVRAEAVVTELLAAGGKAVARQVDVRDPDAVETLADDVFKTYGSVELLVNNAGVENAGLVWETGVDRWNTVMEINVNGIFHGLRSFVPRMIEADVPAVIANMSSVGGVTTSPLMAPYIVSKHAVLALTECLHQDIALSGAPIQVSVICPAAVRSRIFDSARKAAPTTNVFANQLFDIMQDTNDTIALDPLAAAENIVEGIARGDFWVFSDDEACKPAVIDRAEQLSSFSPPADPVQLFRSIGIEA
ncbi:SDR family NAD(P)-dependent oxidoreductase [Streptomyces sp. NPDC002143]